MARDFQVGDWIRFYRDGKLVMGAIEYILARESWELHDTLMTDNGSCRANGVLEMRRTGKDAGTP